MTLYAGNHEAPIEAAAPADLDRLPKPHGVGRLADERMVRLLAVGGHPIEHLARAVDCRTFLIAGDEQADRSGNVVALCLGEGGRCGSEGGDGSLHVAGAASVEHAVLDHAAERGKAP